MDNPYTIKTVFTVHEAAAAICGVTRVHKDDLPALSPTINELLHAMKTPEELPCTQIPRYTTPPRYRLGEPIPLVSAGTDWMRSTIARAALLAWCEQRQIRPALLFPDLSIEKPLNTKERNTLLGIIRALAELHGIKSSSGAYRKEAVALLMELAEKKIIEPCCEKSLSDHLKAAFNQR
ncbi:MAG: hypothetical protein WAW42_04335 [Candidatus Competibacteraceae bacterium]